MRQHAYYNENEAAAAHVLECLIKDGVIADGVVDRRSIADVEPKDVAGFRQAHFFAGGGLWSVAARMAGWEDQRSLWTGSCPCQPFSVAGKGLGEDDPRHLWPHFFRLIRAVRPPVVVGEQVAGKAGYGWFDGVAADLEGEDYTCRAVDIPACAVDAPHIRQRLYWCAVEHASCQSKGTLRGVPAGTQSELAGRGCGDLEHAASERRREGRPEHEFRRGRPTLAGAGRAYMADAEGREQRGLWKPRQGSGRRELPDRGHGGDASSSGSVVNTDCSGRGELRGAESVPAKLAGAQRAGGDAFGLADASGRGRGGRPEEQIGSAQRGVAAERPSGDMANSAGGDAGAERLQRSGFYGLQPQGGHDSRRASSAERASFWSDYEWRTGADGKARRVKPGVRLLVDGYANRVAALRIAGNAIVAPLAAQVLEALMESLP